VTPLLPWVPLTIRFRIGPPLASAALFAADDASLDAARDRVEAAVQALVLG
jgi:hypothetical protein